MARTSAFSPVEAFEPVLETAVALGAPLIRDLGRRPAIGRAGAAERATIVAESRRIAQLARQAGVTAGV